MKDLYEQTVKTEAYFFVPAPVCGVVVRALALLLGLWVALRVIGGGL